MSEGLGRWQSEVSLLLLVRMVLLLPALCAAGSSTSCPLHVVRVPEVAGEQLAAVYQAPGP